MDFHSFSSLLIRGWGHSQLCVAAFVHAAGRAVARLIKRVGDVLPRAQQTLETLHPQCFGQFVWRQPRNAAKSSAESCRVRMQFTRECGNTKALLLRLRKKLRRARDERCGCCRLIRPAAKARPEAVLFRFCPSLKKNDVPPQWAARRARRPAVNMRRSHG